MLDSSIFPSRASLISAHRAPIYYRPIYGSSEQLVVAVLVVGQGSFHLERANQLDRLRCFYGDASLGVIAAIDLSLDDLEDSFHLSGLTDLKGFNSASSGLWIGDIEPAQGTDLRGIGSSWMKSMSSLYSDPGPTVVRMPLANLPERLHAAEEQEPAQSRLSSLLLSYVHTKSPIVANAFSADIRSQKRAKRAHGVIIDFNGQRVVANFGTVSVSHYTRSIDAIKRRMWDLKVSEKREEHSMLRRKHELLAQHPALDDPQLTTKQADKVVDGLRELESEADQLQIRFRPMTTVQEIGDHLLALEAA